MSKIIGQCGKNVLSKYGNIEGEEVYYVMDDGSIKRSLNVFRGLQVLRDIPMPVSEIPRGVYDWGWGALPDGVEVHSER